MSNRFQSAAMFESTRQVWVSSREIPPDHRLCRRLQLLAVPHADIATVYNFVNYICNYTTIVQSELIRSFPNGKSMILNMFLNSTGTLEGYLEFADAVYAIDTGGYLDSAPKDVGLSHRLSKLTFELLEFAECRDRAKAPWEEWKMRIEFLRGDSVYILDHYN